MYVEWKSCEVLDYRVNTKLCWICSVMNRLQNMAILCHQPQWELSFHADDLKEIPFNTFSSLNWNQFHCDAAHCSKLVSLRSADDGTEVLTGINILDKLMVESNNRPKLKNVTVSFEQGGQLTSSSLNHIDSSATSINHILSSPCLTHNLHLNCNSWYNS